MNVSDYTIATLGSHSALDICRGAKDLGFKTLVVVQAGRDKTYSRYYRSKNGLGCVDEVITLDKFSQILSDRVQAQLIERDCIFVPHRSFEVYVNDYDAIEKKFRVKIFGNRRLLRLEERGQSPDQYDLLRKAKIRIPKQFKDPGDIDCLCIVKVSEKERGYERAFFLTTSPADYNQTSKKLLSEGKITKEQLSKAVIEEFVLGVQVNFNFFYSPLQKRVELLGTDTRRQTNLDGLLRLPAHNQEWLVENGVELKYEEAGHIAVTVLESMLEEAYKMGEAFVKASHQMKLPVIGPFALQSVITAGPPKKEIVVFDVSPRMPGSPGLSATPYSAYLYGQSLSMGKRVAMEIKQAIEENRLGEVLT